MEYTLEEANRILGTDFKSWEKLSVYGKLSEDFIREFKNEVNWYHISINQKLSEDFIREFKDRVEWYWISCGQKLSESFAEEFKDRVSSELISKSWRYKDTKYEKTSYTRENN